MYLIAQNYNIDKTLENILWIDTYWKTVKTRDYTSILVQIHS